MFPLSLVPARGQRLEVLFIGAHCDDIEIGCGGTLLALQQQYPDCRVHWLVLTSVPERRRETLAAAGKLVRPECAGVLKIGDLRDGHLPAHFTETKQCFEEMKRDVDPHIVFTHHGGDRHQDHQLVSQITWQTFRDNMIWEYEIPKYDGDLTTPNMYVALPAEVAARKVDTVMTSFASQTSKSWFQADNLHALMRLRGLECRAGSGYAEAFHCRKMVFGRSVAA